MWSLQLIIFCISVNLAWNTYKRGKAKEELCKICIEIKNTSCIAEECDYKYENETDINDEIQNVNEDLMAPELYCQDEGVMVFVWKTEKGTSYFLEYSSNTESRKYTNLTTDNYQILFGLNTHTNYLIQLTSIFADDSVILLKRSALVTVRTLRRNSVPFTVSKFYLEYFELVNTTYTAFVKWEPGSDRSCFYNIVWYEVGDVIDYSQTETNNPLSTREFNITGLTFGKKYSLSINAVRKYSTKITESEKKCLEIVVPTCLETFHSLNYCTPETPQNLEVLENLRDMNQGGFPLYDIEISWSEPNYTPNFYEAVVLTFVNNKMNKYERKVDGNESTANYKNIEIDLYYKVILTAYSIKGPSPSVDITKFANSTAIMLTTESWVTTELMVLILSPLIVIALVLIIVFNRILIKKVRRNYFKELDVKTLPPVNYATKTKLSESDEWELLPEKLMMKDVLGEGAFGVVRRGFYISKSENSVEVAIKMLKDNPGQDEIKQFYQEIDIMKSVPHHPHLLSLIGCVTQDINCRPLLVVEYCSKGDLQTFLRNAWNKLTNMVKGTASLSGSLVSSKYAANKLYELNMELDKDIPQPKDLISYGRQIVLGMEYLSSLKLIHRDLAARNVLICEDNTVKISDFGLSRDVYHDKIYCKTTGGKLPLRWMALESMTHQVYTTQSDVWSFGILLWEIVTLGSTPYPGVSTRDLLPLLKSGYRMEKPTNCSNELYTIMCKCWKASPRERPTFSELRKTLEELLESISYYLHLSTEESDSTLECRKNNINNYKNINFSEGYIKKIKVI